MIQQITNANRLLALILRASYEVDGISFFTPKSFSQQLGYMKRSKGYVISPHVHNPVAREIQITQEVLFIKSGKVRIDFYSEDQRYLESQILDKGDVVLLSQGGHGLEMLTQSEIIEVKQGPYAGDHDKTCFKGVSVEQVRIGGKCCDSSK